MFREVPYALETFYKVLQIDNVIYGFYSKFPGDAEKTNDKWLRVRFDGENCSSKLTFYFSPYISPGTPLTHTLSLQIMKAETPLIRMSYSLKLGTWQNSGNYRLNWPMFSGSGCGVPEPCFAEFTCWGATKNNLLSEIEKKILSGKFRGERYFPCCFIRSKIISAEKLIISVVIARLWSDLSTERLICFLLEARVDGFCRQNSVSLVSAEGSFRFS